MILSPGPQESSEVRMKGLLHLFFCPSWGFSFGWASFIPWDWPAMGCACCPRDTERVSIVKWSYKAVDCLIHSSKVINTPVKVANSLERGLIRTVEAPLRALLRLWKYGVYYDQVVVTTPCKTTDLPCKVGSYLCAVDRQVYCSQRTCVSVWVPRTSGGRCYHLSTESGRCFIDGCVWYLPRSNAEHSHFQVGRVEGACLRDTQSSTAVRLC